MKTYNEMKFDIAKLSKEFLEIENESIDMFINNNKVL